MRVFVLMFFKIILYTKKDARRLFSTRSNVVTTPIGGDSGETAGIDLFLPFEDE